MTAPSGRQVSGKSSSRLNKKGMRMNNVLLCYEELSPGNGYPSMRECFSDVSYKGQNNIVAYLEKGKVTLTSPCFDRDIYTGEIIPGTLCLMTDGEYVWSSTLMYYVKKYNLRLDPEFEKKVLSVKGDGAR